jgi:hypothetical protein
MARKAICPRHKQKLRERGIGENSAADAIAQFLKVRR